MCSTTRRRFLVGLAGAGTQAWLLPAAAARPDSQALPDHWLPLLGWRGDRLQLLVGRSEIGQGIMTSLAQLVAHELGLALSHIEADHARYDPRWPGQGTSASVSAFAEFGRYRLVAASLRGWLLGAAARGWQTEPSRLRLQDGTVVHDGDGRRIGFAQLLAQAPDGSVPMPPTAPLPWPPLARLTPVPRLEARAKIDGSAIFGADVRLPGLLHADWWSAAAGDRVRAARLAQPVPGVREPVVFDDGVALVGDSVWSVRRAMQALRVDSERTEPAPRDDAEVTAALQAALDGPLVPLGPPAEDAAGARQLDIEAEYRLPFAAHAAMEPVTATAHVGTDGVRLWLSTQHPERARQAVAAALAVAPDRVQVVRTLVGGGFGRKTYPDAAVRAARLAAAFGRAVQLSLSREADFAADYLRPASVHRLGASVGADGRIDRWRHDAAAASVLAWYPGTDPGDESAIARDGLSFAGCDANPYAVPRFESRVRGVRTAIRCGIWRSIGHFASVMASECFVDELAARTGQDPLAFRLRHLRHAPRTGAVLERVAQAAGWTGRRQGASRLGLALFREFHARDDGDPADYEVIVAHVARLEPRGRGWRLARLHVAIDAGQIIHPAMVRAQMEGGAAWALSALNQQVRVTDGRGDVANFHTFPVLRMNAMPDVDVHLMASEAWPAGVGEKGVPGVVPAVLNAWFAATGERVRTLPWAGNPLQL